MLVTFMLDTSLCLKGWAGGLSWGLGGGGGGEAAGALGSPALDHGRGGSWC